MNYQDMKDVVSFEDFLKFLEDNFSTINKNISDINESLKSIKTDINNINDEIDKLKNEKKVQNDELSKIKSELKMLNDKIDKLPRRENKAKLVVTKSKDDSSNKTPYANFKGDNTKSLPPKNIKK